MAQRRMFSLKIIDTDLFLDMPVSSQLLYFQLNMRADDEGFVSSPQKIIKMVNCSSDDLKILEAKSFVIPFESGICVIKHWKIHNYIQKDRYQKTLYNKEKSALVEDNGTYKIMDTNCIQDGHILDTQVRLGKVRLGEVSIDKDIVELKTKKKIKEPFLSDSDEYRLSSYLWNYILSNNKQAKEPNLQKWSEMFDLILRIDKREVEEIKKVISFCQKDEFWYKNILSPNKLREHYDKLILQMKQPKYIKSKGKGQFVENCQARDYDFDDLEKKLLGEKEVVVEGKVGIKMADYEQ